MLTFLYFVFTLIIKITSVVKSKAIKLIKILKSIIIMISNFIEKEGGDGCMFIAITV